MSRTARRSPRSAVSPESSRLAALCCPAVVLHGGGTTDAGGEYLAQKKRGRARTRSTSTVGETRPGTWKMDPEQLQQHLLLKNRARMIPDKKKQHDRRACRNTRQAFRPSTAILLRQPESSAHDSARQCRSTSPAEPADPTRTIRQPHQLQPSQQSRPSEHPGHPQQSQHPEPSQQSQQSLWLRRGGYVPEKNSYAMPHGITENGGDI